jgi:hypothetical protein
VVGRLDSFLLFGWSDGGWMVMLVCWLFNWLARWWGCWLYGWLVLQQNNFYIREVDFPGLERLKSKLSFPALLEVL